MIYLLKCKMNRERREEILGYPKHKEPSLQEIRKWIGGGYTEIVRLNCLSLGGPDKAQMIVDEEGLIKWGRTPADVEMHLNVQASLFYLETAIRNIGWINGLNGITPILGDVVILTEGNMCT